MGSVQTSVLPPTVVLRARRLDDRGHSVDILFSRFRPTTRSTGRARASTHCRPSATVTRRRPPYTRAHAHESRSHPQPILPPTLRIIPIFFFMSRSFTAHSFIHLSRSPFRPKHSHHSLTRRLSRNTPNIMFRINSFIFLFSPTKNVYFVSST